MNKFFKKLVDIIFRVSYKMKKFKLKFPNDKIITASGTKALHGKIEEDLTYNVKWITSVRNVLILTDKRLYSGKWNIELDQIEEANLVKIKQLLISGFVLKIRTKDQNFYQFGLQYDPIWLDQNILDMKIEEGKVKMSLFSLLLRFVSIIILILLLRELIF